MKVYDENPNLKHPIWDIKVPISGHIIEAGTKDYPNTFWSNLVRHPSDFWGPESYSDILEERIRKELNWPRCPNHGIYLDTYYIDGYTSDGDWWDYLWVCDKCSYTEDGIDEIDVDEDAEEFGSKFTIMEFEIKEGTYEVIE